MIKKYSIPKTFLMVFYLCVVSFSVEASDTIKSKNEIASKEVVFDKGKWLKHQDDYYPHRDKMLKSILYTDLVRSLNKNEIIKLLGEPTYYRDNKNYLHYLINKKTLLGIWTLHTKTLVIKLENDKTVEWIKIHE